MDLEGLIRKLNFVSGATKLDDDFVDRMNHWWSCMILIMCAIIVSTRQYVGTPLNCWFPQEFHKSWKQYGENYCWIKNTYFVPPNQELPKDYDVRGNSELAYYQWVPYVFMCLAFFFYLPKAVWRLCNWQTGIDVQNIITLACAPANLQPEARKGTLKTLTDILTDAIARIEKTDSVLNRIKQFGSCCVTRARLGRHLTSLYIFVKLLYVVNLLAQFWILKSFIGTQYSFFGLRMLTDLVQGHEWESSGHFPRVTMCDFTVRALGQDAHNYTVQCVLLVNLFNEKIFIILWFWYAIVFVITVASLCLWIRNIILFNQRMRVLRHYLKLAMPDQVNSISELALHDFVSHSLQMDGVFLLRLVESNAGDVMAAHLAATMWQRYLDDRQEKPRGDNDSDNSMPRASVDDNQDYV